MANMMSVKSAAVIEKLAAGESVRLGQETVGPLAESERRLLDVIAQKIGDLEELRQAELVNRVFAELDQSKAEEGGEEPPVVAIKKRSGLRLGRLRAQGYRGLAPSDKIWEFDFAKSSHLFFGPNGSGKTSLIGAACWCLTGYILRDDQPPACPQGVTAYTTAKRTASAGSRPDALSLIDSSGTSTPVEREYWVEIELLPAEGAGGAVWVKRHCRSGLSSSADGKVWSEITSIDDIGVSSLDAELFLLMPARVPHIRFGKDPDLVSVFTQIIGFDDLERVVELAGKVHSASVREANQVQKGELSQARTRVDSQRARVDEVAAKAPGVIAPASVAGALTDGDVDVLEQEVAARAEFLRRQLATDLGIDLTAGEHVSAQLGLLPGQVHSAATELETPLHALFPTSLGVRVDAPPTLATIRQQVSEFEARAKREAEERLHWALRAAESADSGVMLAAARELTGDVSDCPLCGRNLDDVPRVRERLQELRAVAEQMHLHKSIEDLCVTLTAALNELLPPHVRGVATTSLKERLLADWAKLKKLRFGGLLQPVAEKYDATVASLADGLEDGGSSCAVLVGGCHRDLFPSAFAKLEASLGEAHRYLRFAEGCHAALAGLGASVESFLKPSAEGDGHSLLAVVRRGASGAEALRVLEQFSRELGQLRQAIANVSHSELREKGYRELAGWCAPLKVLSGAVRAVMVELIKRLEPRMKALYQALYGDDHLVLDTVTTGHAANPDVKNELNVYLRAGNERIPAAPYANAGRLRAVAISFVFAVL